MQKTRQKIIDYLHANAEATVEELSAALGGLTPVTVRHHLELLRREGLVAPPEVQHRSIPGRPRHVYRLTEKAEALQPRNVQALASHMLEEIKQALEPQQLALIYSGVADRMASELGPARRGETYEQRLERVVQHLSARGYEASWETCQDGHVLRTANCPYRGVVDEHNDLCRLDLQYVSRLLGVVPQRLEHMIEGDRACSYLILRSEAARAAKRGG